MDHKDFAFLLSLSGVPTEKGGGLVNRNKHETVLLEGPVQATSFYVLSNYSLKISQPLRTLINKPLQS